MFVQYSIFFFFFFVQYFHIIIFNLVQVAMATSLVVQAQIEGPSAPEPSLEQKAEVGDRKQVI